jgi:FKBP-type peptidyl-prolyl cis-trans isomerase FklB
MTLRSVLAAVVVLAVATVACAQESKPLPKPDALNDKASYAFGLNLARNFKEQEVPINLDYVVRGMSDGMAGSPSLLTDEEIQATMEAFQQQMTAQQQAKQAAASEKNQKDADAFLAQNKTRAGVTTTESGLQYEVLTAGTGPKPAATDRVKVHYKGTLLDGSTFDSSYERGQPASFPVRGVIPGWTEALQLMPVGSKWKVFIPPALAYGDRGAGNRIGPNSALTFEVELLEILPPAPPAGAPATPGLGG